MLVQIWNIHNNVNELFYMYLDTNENFDVKAHEHLQLVDYI